MLDLRFLSPWKCIHLYYEPRVAVVLKHCQGCMRVHVCVGFVMGRL